jgi:hypothetical protein
MSRQVYLLGVGMMLVALAFVATDWMIGPSPGVTEANARRIKPGMTLGEVEAILGARGLWLGDGTGSFHLPEPYLWTGPDGRVVVKLARSAPEEHGWEQQVVRNGVTFEQTASPGPFARLRAWLGW